MKLAPRVRPKANSHGERSQGGWTQREAVIALISVIVASVSAVASAGSAILSYEQQRMANQERMTPYKTILYNAKLNSYRELNGAFYEFEKQFPINVPIASLHTSDAGRPEYFGNYTKADFQPFEASLAKLRTSIETNRVDWPDEISNKLQGLEDVTEEARECYAWLAHFSHRTTTSLEAYNTNCTESSLSQKTAIYHRSVADVRAAMRSDLRTDKLQAIESDK